MIQKWSARALTPRWLNRNFNRFFFFFFSSKATICDVTFKCGRTCKLIFQKRPKVQCIYEWPAFARNVRQMFVALGLKQEYRRIIDGEKCLRPKRRLWPKCMVGGQSALSSPLSLSVCACVYLHSSIFEWNFSYLMWHKNLMINWTWNI